MPTTAETPRSGRPPKLDDSGVATRERLLSAAIASCVEHGFEGVTVGDIAARADVSAPAIYNHFGGKVELLVAAGRWALDRLGPLDTARLSGSAVMRAFLADGFADSRRLLVELHLAGQRHPEVAELLAAWHRQHATAWAERTTDPDADAIVVTYFALLLGLCQIQSLSSLAVPVSAVADHAEAMIHVLFPQEHPR